MKRLPVLFFGLLFALAFPGCSTTPPSQTAGPLILISIDGFRWDYLEKFPAPTLRQLAAGGVRAERLIPAFPTKSFPNHYTLYTGRRPENHGIVSNYFFDPALNAAFDKTKPADNADPRWWSQAEPIWITAERQGVRSACFFGPGSEAPFAGRRPSYHRVYTGKINSRENIDDLLRQLARPAGERPQFCSLYLDIVDVQGHKFGPDAPETAAALADVDAALAHLLAGLTGLGLRDSANLVIVSDHGMTPISTDRMIFLDDLMPLSTVRVESYGANGGVTPLSGTAADLAASIRAKNIPHLQVYLREEVPAHLHYRNNPRIPAVVLIADEGWTLEVRLGWPKRAPSYDRASHGYDPQLPSMGALFVAHGPAFAPGRKIPAVENIHVYNLLCRVLGITPASNDGDDRLARAAQR
jgi:predicted AlkP superfamily pyrophosphatase or phosphodiesterase